MFGHEIDLASKERGCERYDADFAASFVLGFLLGFPRLLPLPRSFFTVSEFFSPRILALLLGVQEGLCRDRGEVIIRVTSFFRAQLIHVEINENLIKIMRHARFELGHDGGTRTREVCVGEGLAHLQFSIAGHRRDMRQGQFLRIPFQAAKLHLIRAQLHGLAEIAEFIAGGEIFGLRFWKSMCDAGHGSLI